MDYKYTTTTRRKIGRAADSWLRDGPIGKWARKNPINMRITETILFIIISPFFIAWFAAFAAAFIASMIASWLILPSSFLVMAFQGLYWAWTAEWMPVYFGSVASQITGVHFDYAAWQAKGVVIAFQWIGGLPYSLVALLIGGVGAIGYFAIRKWVED